MHAITFAVPPHISHVLMSMLKTRFSRAAQVIALRFSISVFVSSFYNFGLAFLVIIARYWLLGANTP